MPKSSCPESPYMSHTPSWQPPLDQEVTWRAVPHGSWGWVSHPDTGAEALQGQPWKGSGQGLTPWVCNTDFCPCASPGLWRWTFHGSPTMGPVVAQQNIVCLCPSPSLSISVGAQKRKSFITQPNSTSVVTQPWNTMTFHQLSKL